MFDISGEAAAVDGSVEHAGCGDLVGPQGSDEGQGFPMPVRHFGVQFLPALAAPMGAGHVGFGPGLVDEYQAGGIDFALMPLPALPLEGDVRSILLGGQYGFF